MNGPTNGGGKGRPTFGGGSRGGAGGGGFPGFGVATQPIGDSDPGTSPTAARSDHEHPWRHVANQAALDALSAATMLDGQRVWVDTYKDSFTLTASTQAVAANVRRTALGKAGYLWIRDGYSPGWWNQTAWGVNPAAGNDENVGSVASPLATFAEYRRRHFLRWLPGTETASVTVTIAGGDLPVGDYVSAEWANGLRGGGQNLIVNGTATVVASGTIVAGGFNSINRATGQRNTINAGFSWAAHVGRHVRLVATPTTVATIMEDLGGNVCALGEQDVNGTIGAGFTVGQDVEVVTYTAIPGVHIAGPGSPSLVQLAHLDIDGRGAAFMCRHTGGQGTTLNAFQSRFISVTGGNINAPLFQHFGCAFVGPNVITCNAVWFGDTSTSVGLPAGGVLLVNPFSRNHIAGHCSQGPAFTVSENCYANISGTSSGVIGIFGLATGQFGIVINIGARLACSNMWGLGNHAASYAISRLVGAQWCKVGDGAAAFNTIGTAGFLLHRGIAAGDIVVPLTQLPSSIGPGQQPGSSLKFSGALVTDLVLATTSNMADPGSALALAAGNQLPQMYATSERLALTLRVTQLNGPVPVALTVTLYKNGVATTMAVAIPAATPLFTKFVDSAHPTLFADGDDLDLRIDDPGGIGSANIQLSAQLEFAN